MEKCLSAIVIETKVFEGITRCDSGQIDVMLMNEKFIKLRFNEENKHLKDIVANNVDDTVNTDFLDVTGVMSDREDGDTYMFVGFFEIDEARLESAREVALRSLQGRELDILQAEERLIYAIRVKGDQDGTLDLHVAQFPIEKETKKLIYPQEGGLVAGSGNRMKRFTREIIGYKSQINKDDLGKIEVKRYENYFSYTAVVRHNKEKDAMQEMIDEVVDLANKEITARLIIAGAWKEQLDRLQEKSKEEEQ
jgi:hypothetical protein